jgi:TPP-dependent pyruvate/acetoin dehydrogenase alpha subunit
MFLGSRKTVTRNGRPRFGGHEAVSTAAILRVPAVFTIWKAFAIDRRVNGTGQAQKLAGRSLEKGEPSLRVDRCHVLTIQEYTPNAVLKLTSGVRHLHRH